MNDDQLKQKLASLLALKSENEVVEFKEAKDEFNFDKLGKYFSALSNEANIKNKDHGWLILGILDTGHKIVGTHCFSGQKKIEQLKHDIARDMDSRLTFTEIYELNFPEGRVLMFQIPKAPPGIPISFKGHFYGRDGASLVALNISKIELIRSQAINNDWSATIVESATIDDLDPEAIKKGRLEYKQKHVAKVKEVDTWDDKTFLNKAKVTLQGKITNTALLLLGKEDSLHFFYPAVAQISWILKEKNNIERDYQHFGIPFILASEKVLAKIRNLSYRYMPDNTLFPTEISQYDPFVIREALHNCIAHQDYYLQSRINVVEFPDYLIFDNAGDFIPQTVEAAIEDDGPQKFYRNKFLCEAMINLNMIDTIGSGIKKMFSVQRDRFFPLPDYDLSKSNAVKVKIFGSILNKDYTQLLINKTNLDLNTVILLDKVQKTKPISDLEAKHLKGLRLIEGRKPNYHISAAVADVANEKERYIKIRGFKDDYYKQMILSYLERFGSAHRRDIDKLLLDILPHILT